jgi:hypothetical protein
MERDLNDSLKTPASAHPARWWHTLADGRVQCDLCPRDCKLHSRPARPCFVRQNIAGEMVLTTTDVRAALHRPDRKEAAQPFPSGQRRCCLSAPPAATWPASSARTGISASRGTSHSDGASPAGHRRAAAAMRLRKRRVHLQRPGHFCRVRASTPRSPACARHQDRGGHGRLHVCRAARRVLCRHGRRQRRPQGLHRGLLPSSSGRPPGKPVLDTLAYIRTRRELLARDHHPADPGHERLVERNCAPCRLGARTTWARTCRSTSAAFHPDWKMSDSRRRRLPR